MGSCLTPRQATLCREVGITVAIGVAQHRWLETQYRRLGLQARHQTVKGLYVMEGAAATLIVIALELGEIEVLVQGLQLGQSFLQRLCRVGESWKVAKPIRIDHVGHLHHIGSRSRELHARIVKVSDDGEEHGMAACRAIDTVAVSRCGGAACVDDRAVRSHVSHATAQAVFREAQMVIAVVMRRY